MKIVKGITAKKRMQWVVRVGMVFIGAFKREPNRLQLLEHAMSNNLHWQIVGSIYKNEHTCSLQNWN